MTSKLFLHDHPVSSYAQKVRMALRHKSIPFDFQTPPNLGSGDANPDFFSANPRMEVPALVVDDDFKIFESSVILQYLEDKYPQPSLFGSQDPKDRAEQRMIETVCDTHYEAINWGLGEINWFERAKGPEADRLKSAAAEQTAQIQTWLTTKLGTKPFYNGPSPGYADYSVAPILNRSVYNGMGPAENTPLHAWWVRCKDVPAIAETWEEMAAAADMMKKMGPSTFAPGTGRRREYRDHRLEFLVKNGGVDIVMKGIEEGTIRFGWPHPATKIS